MRATTSDPQPAPSATARLTSANAVAAVHRLIAQTGNAIGEVAPVPALKQLSSDVAAISEALLSDSVVVDVAISPEAGIEAVSSALSWLSGESATSLATPGELPREWRVGVDNRRELLLRTARLDVPQARRATEVPAALLCIVSGDAPSPDATAIAARLASSRPLTIVIGECGPRRAAEMCRAISAQSWVVESFSVDALPAQTLVARLNTPTWIELVTLCRVQGATRCLLAIGEVARLALEEEARALRGRKAVAQQRVAGVQRVTTNPAELMGELRGIGQRFLTEFERGSKERLSRFTTPGLPRSMWIDVEACLATLCTLDRGGSSGQSEVHVPDSFEKSFVARVRRSLESHLASDVAALHEHIALLGDEIDRVLISSGYPPVPSAVRPIGAEAVRLLATRVRIERAYRGELPMSGIDEYLAIVRRNYIVVSLSTTLVGILGLRSVLASPRTLLFLMALLPVAGYAIHRTVQRSRREALSRELERARDCLRAEARRIAAEIERAWEAVLQEFVRDGITSLLTQLDTSVRTAANRRLEETNEEKRQVQRQLASLETPERQLTAAGRARAAGAAATAQFFGELRQLFLTLRERLEAQSR